MAQQRDKIRQEVINDFAKNLTSKGTIRGEKVYANKQGVVFRIHKGLLYKTDHESMPDYPIAVMGKSVTEKDMEEVI